MNRKYFTDEERKEGQRQAQRRYENRHRIDRLRSNQKRDMERRSRLNALEILGNECKHCGTKDTRVLCIDHIQPLKTGRNRIKNSVLYRQIIKGDVANLQLLCANCHMIKTWRSEI